MAINIKYLLPAPMLRGYIRIMSDRYPIHVRSISDSQADIYTPKSPSNTLRMGYELLREHREIPF